MIFTPPPHSDRWQDPALLAHLERLRRPFHQLNRRIVRLTLERFLPSLTPQCPCIEIGAGGGQLRDWLPVELLANLLHTEPSEPFIEHFRKQHPDGRIIRASANSLPVPDGSQSAVLGLCAFDALECPEEARDEVRRVLAPGGTFCHFLDLGTDLEPLFRDLLVRGEMPLPNFLAGDVPPHDEAGLRARLPSTGPLDDMLIVKELDFRRFCALVEKMNHPLREPLAGYAALFDSPGLDARKATLNYMALVSDRDRLAQLNRVLLSLYTTFTDSAPGGYQSLRVKPYSSLDHLDSKLSRLFTPEAGFVHQASRFLRAREVRPRDPDVPGDCVYRGRWIGRTVLRTQLPRAIPGVLLEELKNDSLQGNEHIVESVMHVFVAYRQA